MRLSVCLITRNEEHNLPRALKSVAAVADEIIVADTGSTDRTIQIARDAGAHVCEFQWCDDFSAARNFSISHAIGDWIFWLDADEALLEESVEEVRRRILDPKAMAYFVLRQDLADAAKPDFFTEMWQMRLFRRRDNLRFIGRCHPDFQPPIEQIARQEGKTITTSTIRLRHWGYLAELKPAKLSRTVRLLEMELRDRPGNLYYLIELGRTLSALNDISAAPALNEATAQMLRHRHDAIAPTSLCATLLEHLMHLPPTQLPHGLTTASMRELMQRWFPRSIPLRWASAGRYFDVNDFAAAAKELEAILNLAQSDSYDKTTSFNPRIAGDDALFNLGVCYIRIGKLDQARSIFERMKDHPDRAQQARQNLDAIAQLRTTHG